MNINHELVTSIFKLLDHVTGFDESEIRLHSSGRFLRRDEYMKTWAIGQNMEVILLS